VYVYIRIGVNDIITVASPGFSAMGYNRGTETETPKGVCCVKDGRAYPSPDAWGLKVAS